MLLLSHPDSLEQAPMRFYFCLHPIPIYHPHQYFGPHLLSASQPHLILFINWQNWCLRSQNKDTTEEAKVWSVGPVRCNVWCIAAQCYCDRWSKGMKTETKSCSIALIYILFQLCFKYVPYSSSVPTVKLTGYLVFPASLRKGWGQKRMLTWQLLEETPVLPLSHKSLCSGTFLWSSDIYKNL